MAPIVLDCSRKGKFWFSCAIGNYGGGAINWLNIVRWVHILAGAAWLGEVVTINFVLVPALSRMDLAERGRFVRRVFPRVFRLASVLAATTLLAGLALGIMMTGWRELDVFLSSRRGLALLAGGALGLLLALFHFLAERRLRPQVLAARETLDREAIEAVTRMLRVVPRLGLGVMVAIFLLMMIAARGL